MAAKKSSKKSSSQPELGFEAAMAELEALVARMEKGDRTLEDSLKDFERGVALTRICQATLRDAEQKVQQLMSDSQREELVDFEPGEQDP